MQQAGARKALLRWVQYTATKYGADWIFKRQFRKPLTSLLVQLFFSPNKANASIFVCLFLRHDIFFFFSRRLGIEVKDFGPSWRTGLAFFAVIHALRPSLVDMEDVCRRPNRENLTEAFLLAERELGIPQLLDPDGKRLDDINKN